MQPNNALGVTGVDSLDSHTNNASITDPTANVYNMLYTDGSGATATGGAGNDLLSGAGTTNHLIGGAGDDILVYRPVDIQLDGGTGFDILRVDQGAIYNSSLEVTGASANGLPAVDALTVAGDHLYKVDLSAAPMTNMEAILLTEEPIASASYGTQLEGLSVSKVVASTEATNSVSSTAHSLFIIGSPGDDVQLATGATGWTETANTVTSAGGQVFHQWVATTGGAATASLFIDNDLQVNHAVQA
jgi:hypothetical protein